MGSLRNIVSEASKKLPQAVWYDPVAPSEGFMMMDSFLFHIKDDPMPMTTNYRLVIVEGTLPSLAKLLVSYHRRTFGMTFSRMPVLPNGAKLVADVACFEVSQSNEARRALIQTACNIQNELSWPIIDLGLKRPEVILPSGQSLTLDDFINQHAPGKPKPE